MNKGARMYFAGDREDDDLLAGPSRYVLPAAVLAFSR